MHSFDLSIPSAIDVRTESESRQWLEYFSQSWKQSGGIAVDTETTGLDKRSDRPIVWSVSDGVHRLCLPAEFLGMWKPLLENPEIVLIFTNAKFDLWMLRNAGIDASKAGFIVDTVVMDWLFNENRIGRHGLKDTTRDYFHRATPEFEQIFGKVPPKRVDKVTGKLVSKTPGDLINELFSDPNRRDMGVDYSSLDAYNSYHVYRFLSEELKKVPASQYYPTLLDYFWAVEVPFTKVLFKCEARGVTVYRGYLQGLQGPMEMEMEAIRAEFSAYATQALGATTMVNLDSVHDVRMFFFDVLKKTPSKMTEGGSSGIKRPSTDSDVLEEWAGKGDYWANTLLRYRKTSKICSTYVKGIQSWLDYDYRIHTSLNQTGTVTGRLSSSEPNLQNIPRPDEDQFKIRDAFIPGDGMELIVADYEQLEMRIMAHFADDKKMIEAIMNGIDLHCFTVSEAYGVPYDEVNGAKKADKDHKAGKGPEPTPRQIELLAMRTAAKRTGFGIIYGIGGPGLAAQLTQDLGRLYTPEEGNASINRWFSVFPLTHKYILDTRAKIERYGYVQTYLGTYRRFGDFKVMSKQDRAQALRQGGNAEIQGTAANIAKMAMIIADNDVVLNQLGAQLLLQVHDELIFECPEDKNTVKAVKERVKLIMENSLPQPLRVPLPASVGSGKSWSRAK